MSLLALDLNATRIRAVWGEVGDYPSAAPLDLPHVELPLTVNLEGRSPAAGMSGLLLCRKSPNLVLQNFLPKLGESPPANHNGKRCKGHLRPDQALALVLQHVLQACRRTTGVVLALPPYLSDRQVEMLLTVACQAGLPVLGSIASPLAAALTGHAEETWFGTSVAVVDIDDQALTVATMASAAGHAHLADFRCFPHLNLRIWQERLLNAVADSCILESRWDPRESPLSDQSLFDQLGEVLDAAQQGRMIKLALQTPKRFQSLVLPAHAPAGFCANLRRQTLAELDSFLRTPCTEGMPGSLLLTAAAARLPGLTTALQTAFPQWTASAAAQRKPTASALEDFGSTLLDGHPGEASAVSVLTAGATAQGAHAIGAHFQRGDLACGHIDTKAPLPLPLPLEAGPARLHFQGRDYLLGSGSFILGRQPPADLMFDAEKWPHVAGRHCDIIYDHRAYMLYNRSRDGTLVNDRATRQAVPLRAGDWIRLGPDGPLVRFLGQASEKRKKPVFHD